MLDLKKIIFLKGVNPIQTIDKPSAKTLDFVNLLLIQKDFSTYVLKKRKEFKIPEDGNDILKVVGMKLSEIGDTNLNSILLITNDFVKSTGLAEEYVLQIALLVLYNSIIDLRYFKHEPAEPHEFVFGRKKISTRLWDYPYEVGAIIVPFNIKKTKLKQWLDKNWDSIVNDMDNNFTTNPFILRIHKNLLLEEEISRLKEIERKSFTEILKIFKQKYPQDNWKLSRITKIYYDARQRQNLADKTK